MSIESKLIDIRIAAVILSAPIETARILLKDLPCIDYGKGRGRGKRWRRKDVERLADTLPGVSHTSAPTASFHVADLSARELLRLTRNTVIQ